MDLTARFAELVQGPEAELPLDEAALLIAAHADPDVDIGAELGALDELASRCPEPTLEGWRRYLFVDLGFTGNVEHYYDPANSFIHEVVRRRAGLPITLSVVSMEVGRRLGLRFNGVGMPGHFLLRHDPEAGTEGAAAGAGGAGTAGAGTGGAGIVYVDPFAGGRLLDRAACEERFHVVNGAGRPFLPSYLDPLGPQAILGRMLANLKAIYASLGDLEALAWVFALRLSIPGVPALERRELARVLGSTGRFAEAARELEELAETVPTLSDTLLSEAIALRGRLN